MDPEKLQELLRRTYIRDSEPFKDSVFRAELEKLDRRYTILNELFRELEKDKTTLLKYVVNRKYHNNAQITEEQK